MMLSLWQTLLPLLVALALFAVGLLFGRLLLTRSRTAFSSELSFLCAAQGVGLGVLGLAGLLLGMAGGWRPGFKYDRNFSSIGIGRK